jgi:hypothetical protein
LYQSRISPASFSPIRGAYLSYSTWELANLTSALASGQRPDVVLTAIAEREAAKKKAASELARLEKLERAARDFDAGAAEKKLRAELKTWREMLERDPTRGRVALREMLQAPIQAEYSATLDHWSFAGVASLDGITKHVLGVNVAAGTAATIDRLGLTQDDLDRLIREELARERARREGKATGPDLVGRLLAGGSAENAGTTSASSVHRPSCPRGDSNTRHAV